MLETIFDYVVPALLLAILCIMAVALALIQRKFQRLSRAFTEFVTPLDDKTPSQAAMLVNNIAATVGNAVSREAKGALAGMLSGKTRNEKAIERELMTEAIGEANPVMGALMEIPAIAKLARKQPGVSALLMAAAERWSNRQAATAGPPPSERGNGQAEFKL